MKVIYGINDFIKVFRPFANGCHFKAVIDGSVDFKFTLGCYGVMIRLCSGLEKELINLFTHSDNNSIHSLKEIYSNSDREIIFDFLTPELIRIIAEMETCVICGGTLFKQIKHSEGKGKG